MDKIKELLNINSLDESTQQEVINVLDEMVEAKAKVRAKEMTKKIAEPIINEAVEEKTVELEEKFEEYKEMITSNFSDFIDETLETELELPDHIVEYARKGELYSDLIDQFKKHIAVDEGTLEAEAKDLLKEAKEEIISLRDQIDNQISENYELKSDAKKMASHIYIQEKCTGLPESAKSKIITIIGEETDTSVIDSKYDELVDIFVSESDDKDDDKETKKGKGKSEVSKKTCVCPECGKETTINEGSCSLYECSECEGVKLTDKKDEKKEDKKEDKEDKKEDLDENVNNQGASLFDEWIKIAKDKKY